MTGSSDRSEVGLTFRSFFSTALWLLLWLPFLLLGAWVSWVSDAKALAASVLAVCATGILRSMRVRLSIRSGGLLIVNPLRTTYVPYSEVHRTRVSRTAWLMGEQFVFVDRRDQRSVRIWVSLARRRREEIVLALRSPRRGSNRLAGSFGHQAVDGHPSPSLVSHWSLTRAQVKAGELDVRTGRWSVLGYFGSRLPLAILPALIAGLVPAAATALLVLAILAVMVLSVRA